MLVPFRGFIDCGTENEKVNVVAKQFMTALQSYTQVEKEYRQKQRARVERQFKIGQSCPTSDETALNPFFDSQTRRHP